MKKYQRIAEDIEVMIEEGRLSPGEKLLSLRELSVEKDVGLNTIIRAYELLEQKGLITTKSQSGFYVNGNVLPTAKLLAHDNNPVEVKVQDLMSLMIDLTKYKQSVPFGVGFLSPDLYPCEDINRITRQVLREDKWSYGSYSHAPGELEYRRQVSKYLKQRGCSVDKSEILATNGTMDSVLIALRAVCEPGDTVVIESPMFYGIIQILETLKLKVIEVPCHPIHGIDLEHLRNIVKNNRVKAALVMPNFNNPMGCLVSDENKRELINILVKRNIVIIENDVYSDLAHNGIRPEPLKSIGPADEIITCSSFSKTISPALRIGWIAPGKYYQKVKSVMNGSTTGTSGISQKILARYLGTKDHQQHLQFIQNQCSTLVGKMSDAIRTHFPEETRISTPKGGLVLWMELPKNIDSVELYKRCMTRQIVITPGVMFSANSEYRNYCRINCGNTWNPRIEKGVSELGDIIKEML